MKNLSKLALALALSAGALTFTAPSAAAAGGGFHCPDVYDPVICSNGQIYGNSCYASRAGATGCVPYGVAS
jgi:hypothetical protein